MDDRCYFCHRSLEECRQYLDELIDENMPTLLQDERIPSGLSEEEKRDWVHKEHNFSKYGFSEAKLDYVSLDKGLRKGMWFKVPICPICNSYMNNIINELAIDD